MNKINEKLTGRLVEFSSKYLSRNGEIGVCLDENRDYFYIFNFATKFIEGWHHSRLNSHSEYGSYDDLKIKLL